MLPKMRSPLFFALGALLACHHLACHHEDPLGSVPLDAPVGAAIYVVNGGDASITVFDLDTLANLGTISLVGARSPHHVSLSPDGARLLVADPGEDLSGGHSGHGAAGSGALFMLDADDGATLRTRRLPHPNHNGVFAPDQSAIYTAQADSPGGVLVLDPETLVTGDQIPVGDDPAELTLTADGTYLFAANHGSGDVTVISPGEDAVVTRIPVGQGPVGAWPGPDRFVYVDNEQDRTISEIDTQSLAVTRTLDLGFAPGSAAVPPSGGELWVTDPDGGRVTFWSLGDGSMTGELATGAGAHAIAFSPDGARAFVTNQMDDSLSVIDLAMRSVLQTIPTGAHPNGLAVRPG